MAVAPATQHAGLGHRIGSLFPILTWGRSYNKAWLRPDLIAGVTVAAFAIPEDLAYASLAGLEPQHALYANLIALLVYAAMGTSRQLSYSVTSALSIMVAGSLGVMTFSEPDQYAAAAAMVAVMSGLMALLAGIFRVGFIVNFVSESILTGFSAGAALYIASSQVSKLFGIEGVQGSFFERIWNVLTHLGETNGPTLLLGATTIVILLVLERTFPRLPASLLITIVAITLMWGTNLESRGIEVAGTIPGGLPTPAFPSVSPDQLNDLLMLAFGVFLLSYVEGVGAARTFASRHKYEIDANQELYANGGANLASGLMQGYSVGGSMSRSAVNDEGGAKTPLAGLFAAVVIALVLLFLTEPFSYLPETVLAAIVIVAVKGLIDIPALKRLYHLSTVDFLAAMFTMLGVLTFGMLEGIIIGVLFSFLAVLKRVSLPHTSLLARRPDTNEYVSITHLDGATPDQDIMIFRADAGWFYANVPVIKQDFDRDLGDRAQPPSLVVIDLATAPQIDLGSVETLDEIRESLAGKHIPLRLANVHLTTRDMIQAAAPEFGTITPSLTIADVIDHWKREAHQEALPSMPEEPA